MNARNAVKVLAKLPGFCQILQIPLQQTSNENVASRKATEETMVRLTT